MQLASNLDANWKRVNAGVQCYTFSLNVIHLFQRGFTRFGSEQKWTRH